MRFSVATVFALAGLSIAGPVGQATKRADAVSLLSDLYATVQVYTGAISTFIPTRQPKYRSILTA
jgi:outer membrane lipoprotein-sorting protein